MTAEERLALADWRRRVAEMYAAVRAAADPTTAWGRFRQTRDALFADHPQTPLSADQRRTFSGLDYYSYDQRYRAIGRFDPESEGPVAEIELPADGLFRYRRIGFVHFTLVDADHRLGLYWVEGYGGGVFLPFRDLTNSRGTYGGGRYLYDAIKGADLNAAPDSFLLDFNFAYNPSCAYNDLWVCPLSPPENRLDTTVAAGERAFH